MIKCTLGEEPRSPDAHGRTSPNRLLYWKNFFSITVRDLAVVGCCILVGALVFEGFLVPGQELEARDGQTQADSGGNRLATGEEIAAWLSYQPVSKARSQAARKKDVFRTAGPRQDGQNLDASRSLMPAHAHRHSRNARHSGPLRRDLRPSSPRNCPPGLRSVAMPSRFIAVSERAQRIAAFPSLSTSPPSATSTSIPRLHTPFLSTLRSLLQSSRDVAPLLQRRERPVHAASPA